MSAPVSLQGPRCALGGELGSIAELADAVFMSGRTGIMGDLFPRLFHRDNLENLFVFSEAGRVVCHVGMIERRARIAACELQVACMGAVATHETCRGRGMASQLVLAALDKARADGVDVVLISGDRTLYRRVGAFPVGCDFQCVADARVLERAHDPRLRVRGAFPGDLSACSAAYDAKPVRFVRPMREWKDRTGSNAAAEGRHHLLVVEEEGAFRGYAAVNREDERGYGEVVEIGGAPAAVAGALYSISRQTGQGPLKIRLQQHDTVLRGHLTDAGAMFAPVSVDGSWMIAGFVRLMERLRPWIEERAGRAAVQSLQCGENEGTCMLSMLGETAALSRTEAVRMIFGTPDGMPPCPPAWRGVFPLPTVAYGIGYV